MATSTFNPVGGRRCHCAWISDAPLLRLFCSPHMATAATQGVQKYRGVSLRIALADLSLGPCLTAAVSEAISAMPAIGGTAGQQAPLQPVGWLKTNGAMGSPPLCLRDRR